MLRWQQEDDDAEYPALDFDDVEFILTEEDSENLIVLCEKPTNGRRQARIIGYSYAYEEPWDITDEACKKEKNKGKGKTKDGGKNSDKSNSLYIAEVCTLNRKSFVCPKTLLSSTVFSMRMLHLYF